MDFRVEDIADLLRLIYQHLEWRDQLRAAILPSKVLALPQSIAQLVEAQKRFQQTLEAHNERIARLEQIAEAHNERLDRLERIAERHDKH